jgi:Arc/MetJ-type ribon-helix-helix transcriptional regulator
MASNSSHVDVQKITVSVPRQLLNRLDEHVARRQRGRFIVEAIEERLDLEEQVAALDETAGAWSDEDHPDMLTDQDIDHWLEELRRSWSSTETQNHG